MCVRPLWIYFKVVWLFGLSRVQHNFTHFKRFTVYFNWAPTRCEFSFALVFSIAESLDSTMDIGGSTIIYLRDFN